MNSMYISTRNDQIKVTGKKAITEGLADDGGLFVLPHLFRYHLDLTHLLKKNYKGIANEILERLLPEFSKSELNQALHNAYDNSFNDNRITPLKSIGNFYVLELFHGPTSAFKDIGLQLLPELMKLSLSPKHKVMILVATSGDTGTAALEGFKDVNQMGISVFYPHGGVSPIQQQQMLTTNGNNTNLAAIKGNFDDAQTSVKKTFKNLELSQKLGVNVNLSSANSINIGRLLPQIIYYFYAYKQLVDSNQISIGDKVSYTVPTGNFGDILAGYYAKLLGLPVKKLIIACNANKVLADFLAHGVYNTHRPFIKTIAPSMDIQVSSNFERLLFYESHEDTKYVKSLMNCLESTGKYRVSKSLLQAIRTDFTCGYSNDKQIKQAIKHVFYKDHYLMDTHTACGYVAMEHEQIKDPDTPMILLSTASPYKFVNAVADAILGNGNHKSNLIMTTQSLNQYTGVPIPKNLVNIWELPKIKAPIINAKEIPKFVYEKTMEMVNHD